MSISATQTISKTIEEINDKKTAKTQNEEEILTKIQKKNSLLENKDQRTKILENSIHLA